MVKLSIKRYWFSLLPGLVLLLSTATLHAAEPTECVAEYDLWLKGKRVGTMVSTLSSKHDNHWHYQLDTKAKRGLIKAKVKQSSEFLWDGQFTKPVTFQSSQKIAFAKRKGNASYDWEQMLATGTHKKKAWELAMPPQFVNRLTLNEQLRIDLKNDPARSSFSYQRLDRGKLKPMVFTRKDANAAIEVPAGNYQTILLEREHGADDRRTASWHSASLNYLPVRMEQLDGKELTVTELRKFEGCR